MRSCSLLALLALILSWPHVGAAQEDDLEPTLPPVVVEPPEEEPPAEPEVEPPEDDEPDPFEPFELSETYPSLAEQLFEDLTGALRAERSVFDDPRFATIIGPQELAERTPTDMGQALERETGVMIQRTGAGHASPFVRGLTGQQVLILVDGIRLTNATFRSGPNQYFNLVDPGQVERIEVVRGPQSVLYGSDALGGVINIVTKSPTNTGSNYLRPGTVQRFSTADLGYYGRLNVEGWVGQTGVFGGGGGGNFNNIDRGGDLGRQPATSFNQASGDVKLRHVFDRFSHVTIAYQHFEHNDLFRSDRFPANRETIFDPEQRDLAYLRWQGVEIFPWLDACTITGSFAHIKEDRTDRRPIGSPVEEQNVFTNGQLGLNLLATTELPDGFGRLNYGFDWYHEEVNAQRRRVDRTTDPPTVTPLTPPQFPPDAWYASYGAYMEWDVKVTDRLWALAGVRFTHIQAAATILAGEATGPIDPYYDDWTKSLGLTYELAQGWNLVGSVSEGFRAPNLDDLTAVNTNIFTGVQIPNPDLDPERSINYEVGMKFDTDRLQAQAFVFWTFIDGNLLQALVDDPEVVFQRENRDSKLQGVELAWQYLLDVKREWSVYGNFFYTFGHDIEADEPLSRIPPTQGILGLRRRAAGGRRWFDVYTWLVARQDRLSQRDLLDTIRIPPGGTPGYGTLNFRYGRMFGERHRLALNWENVTDRAYRVHGSGVDGPGSTVILSYEWLH